jgi:hypothetical protein
MDPFMKMRKRLARSHGAQTITEFALGLMAIAVAVYAAYRLLGGSIGSLASR